MDLDKYIVKVLTHEEMCIIKGFAKTIYCSYQDHMEMFDFTKAKYFSGDHKSIVLCYPQTIEQNIKSICDGHNAIIFISDVSYMDAYYNPQIWFWAEYSSPNIKDILTDKFCFAIFDSTKNYHILEKHEQLNKISKKIITHFQNIFMLFKEVCDVDDIIKYIFAIVFSKISFDEKKMKDEPY